MDLGTRYRQLLEEIHTLAEECSRDPSQITLVVVSKQRTVEEIRNVYDAGCRDFGENRLPEALEKIEQLPKDIRWHFIGSLQRKKVPKLANRFALIHSVDSLALAEKLAQVQYASPVLLEVNTSKETTKHGFTPRELQEAFSTLKQTSLTIRGLMTMAPLSKDSAVLRRCFADLRELRDLIEKVHHCRLPDLSMGMTNDYRYAIQEGATLLRIGTALFARSSP